MFLAHQSLCCQMLTCIAKLLSKTTKQGKVPLSVKFYKNCIKVFIYFISIFYPPDSQESDGGANRLEKELPRSASIDAKY